MDNDLLIIRVRTDIISNNMDLSKIVDMLSCPKLDLGLSLLTILDTRSVVTMLK